MVKKYVVERRSWIILFLFLQLLVLFVSFVDSSIPFMPILYIVFLSTLIFIGFFLIRYHKETKFYKSIEVWDQSNGFSALAEAESPFEKIVEESVIAQNELYRNELSQRLIEVEQEKDELLSWIHEVKTPLTTMQLMIERSNDETLKGQLMYEWLRIHLLLDQQLHQKRIPFIKNDLYIEQAALEPIIFKEIKELKIWCMQKGIGFDVTLQVAEVLTDAKWLGFIIRQLLTNAVKYSEISDIIIESNYDDDGQAKLVIKDFGRGIDPKDQPRIFDKGFTSTTQHQDTAATGMGLYLTQKVANSLFIHIDVSSELGVGTTFTLTFPQKNAFVSITSM
ncbi:sensor histidine kinase [Paenibacillus sp. N3/727]|uniref:sensor histidine kinase n=1 Tax=Paenibacillus sp. N3/727 TaxID=2925845 RepID=UPI001F537168|nr:sensor histidine kinase [Paenibacillus sp. N3/727]UNK17428.1 sensor histidine kinase [Paenibacillus sp. N3/727]